MEAEMQFSPIYLLLIPIVFMLTMRKLLYGVYILILLLPIQRFWVTQAYNLSIKLAEWMGLVCVIVFLWNYMARPKKGMFNARLVGPLFIFAFVNVLFLLMTLSKVSSEAVVGDWNSPGYRSIKVVIWCIYSILLALSVSFSIKDKQDLRKCISVLLWVNVIICTISLISMILNLVGVPFATWTLIGRAGFVGIKGTFSEPAYFAIYLSAILPVALLVFILRVYKLGLFFTVAVCFILLLANYFSFSTTGVVGIMLTLVLLPYFIRHYRIVTTAKGMRYAVTIVLCVYIVFLVGALFNVDFFKVTTLNYFEKLFRKEARWAARVMGYQMFVSNPVTGAGPGNWAWLAQKGFEEQVEAQTYTKPSYNCLYWEILVDLGLIGFIPFAFFFLNLFRELSKAVWRARDALLKAVLVGLIVGFIALLAEYYVCFNFYRIHVWAMLGIAMAAIRLAKEEAMERGKG